MPTASGPRGAAVVTGAGGMMGGAIARLLVDRYNLVLNDRRDSLGPLVEELSGPGVELAPVVADVGRPEGAAAAVDAALERWGRVDVLVNVAGGIKGPIDNPVWSITDDQWSRVLQVNLSSAFYCIRRAAGPMMEQRSGKIVSIASTSWAGSPAHAHYAAAKAGLVALTRSVAEQLGPYNVNVNAVAPGGTLTLAAGIAGFPAVDDWRDRNPLGRPNAPEDIAHTVAFLLSEQARNISGQLVTVAGGVNPSL